MRENRWSLIGCDTCRKPFRRVWPTRLTDKTAGKFITDAECCATCRHLMGKESVR